MTKEEAWTLSERCDAGTARDGRWRAVLAPCAKRLRGDCRGACRSSADACQRRRRGAKDHAALRDRRLQLLKHSGCPDRPLAVNWRVAPPPFGWQRGLSGVRLPIPRRTKGYPT